MPVKYKGILIIIFAIHTIRIGSTPTFIYFDLCLYSGYYAAHYVYIDTYVHSITIPINH